MKQEGINGCLKLTTGKNQVDVDRITYHLWEFHMCLIFKIELKFRIFPVYIFWNFRVHWSHKDVQQ